MISVGQSEAQLGFAVKRVRRAPEIRPPEGDEVRARMTRAEQRWLSTELLLICILASAVVSWLATIYLFPLLQGDTSNDVVVERIIRAESNGSTKAKNPRSTATGSGQFIEQTWLEMMQKHRQDLVTGRSRDDLLAMRGDPALTREIVTRMVQNNAKALKRRGLPVTPGTLYLAHFAGTSGAVALLTSADELDAATLMASADSTGKSSREQLVKANPFLAKFTVRDMKSWANHKMRG
jgi:hypothetical protein